MEAPHRVGATCLPSCEDADEIVVAFCPLSAVGARRCTISDGCAQSNRYARRAIFPLKRRAARPSPSAMAISATPVFVEQQRRHLRQLPAHIQQPLIAWASNDLNVITRAQKQRGVEFEGWIFRRRADQRDRAVFHHGQKMNLVARGWKRWISSTNNAACPCPCCGANTRFLECLLGFSDARKIREICW